MDIKDLPRLTPKQSKFVDGVLEGKTLADAYRSAYDTSNWTDEAIWTQGSRLASNPKVVLWLDHARQAQADKKEITLESHLAELERIKKAAEADKGYTAVLKAEELRGKATGLYVERVKNESDVDLDQLLAVVEAVMGEGIASEFRAKLGMDEQPRGAKQAGVAPNTPSQVH